METTYQKPVIIAVLFSLTVMCSGCGLSRILRADFDQYSGTPANEMLQNDIPGIPDGDRIDNVIPTVLVEENGPLTGKNLRIDGQLDFIVADHKTPDKYVISWKGKRNQFDTGVSTISFLDSNGNEALVLRFDGQSIRQLTGDNLEPPAFHRSAIATHSFSVEINMAGVGHTSVTYQEEGQSQSPIKIDHPNLRFRDSDFNKLRTIRFHSPTNGTYHLDDLNVFTKSN